MIDLLAQGFAPNLDLRSKWLMGIVVGALGIMYLVAVVLRKQRPQMSKAAALRVQQRCSKWDVSSRRWAITCDCGARAKRRWRT